MRRDFFSKVSRLMLIPTVLLLIPGWPSQSDAPLALRAVTTFPSAIPQNASGPPQGSGVALACRALEVKTAERLGVAVALFHQASKSDGPRLGKLLRAHDGASVEFDTSDGHSHSATLFRLGTCFGRGLLLFPAGSARLAAHEQFWLRFPEEAALRPASQ
jgi:hypothetical protein